MRPVQWLASGLWPDGELIAEAPPEAHRARANAMALRDALRERNLRQVAADADLAHTTIYDLLRGHTYGDVITLSRLEVVLGASLWPSDA